MARRFRIYNTVRTDTLESKIAFYQSQGDTRTANAFITLARDIGAPVRQTEIEKLQKMFKEA
jgi:hypothetical protein